MTIWHVLAAVLPVLVAELGLLVRDVLSAGRKREQQIDRLEERVAALERKTGCLR